MIYKVVMSTGDPVLIESEADLQEFLKKANNPNQKLILTKHGVINVSFIVSVIPHKEKLTELSESIRYGKTEEQARADLMPPSPFAKLLAGKLPKLSPESRTKAQEEVAREEHKGK